MTDDSKKPVTSPTLSKVPSETASPASSESEQPEIYGIAKGKDGITLNRRSFLGAAAAMGATGALAGCIPLPGFGDSDPTGPPATDGAGKAHDVSIVGLELRDSALFSWDANTLKAWDVSTGTLRKYVTRGNFAESMKQVGFMFPDLFLHIYDAVKVAIGPDGNTLAVDGKDGVALWRPSKGKPEKVKTLKGAPGTVTALALHPDGGMAAAGGPSGRNFVFVVWNVKDGRARTFRGEATGVHSLAFHPAEPWALSAHGDGTVRIWNLSDGKLIKTLNCHDKSIRCLEVTPDGKLAVTASDDATIKLWSLPDGKEMASMKVPLGEATTAMNLSDDGGLLATGTMQGRIYLWRLPEGEMMGCLFDPALLEKGTPMAQHRQMTAKIFTQPCDKPLPAGATCVCDCVAANRMCSSTTQTICTCDTIAVPAGYTGGRGVCVCNTIAVGTRAAPQPVSRPAPPGCSCVNNVSHGGSHYWRPN